MDIIASVIAAYFIYMLQKIDKRQDKIELDIAVIKASIPKRFDDER